MIDTASQTTTQLTPPLFEAEKAQAAASNISQEMQDLFAKQLSAIEATQVIAQKAEDQVDATQDNSTGFALLERSLPKETAKTDTETVQKIKGRTPYSVTNLNQRNLLEDKDGVKIAQGYNLGDTDGATKVREITDFTWDDFLDFINPLQHIPVINEIYRSVSGDEIKPSVQVAGSIAYGAATGSLVASAVTGIVSAMYEESAGGESPLQQLASAVMGDEETLPQTALQQVATASSTDQTQALKEEVARKAVLRAKTILAQMPGDESVASMVGGSRLSKGAVKTKGTLAVDGALSVAKTTTQSTKTTASVQNVSQKLSDSDLVLLMQKQAAAKAAGQEVQSALIPDMMFQALDKYQKAAAITAQ